MKIIKMTVSSNTYNICIKSGLFSEIGDMLTKWYKGSSIAVITDSNIDQLYGKNILDLLENSGYKANIITVPAGEQSKSLLTLNYVYGKLADADINRSSLIIAFGGGVVGDLTGFAAATYMRGVPYVQVPTSLMAQLDSSIGGKTAINLKFAKNMAGCFYHPRAVYIDPDLLNNLTERVFCDGLAEAVKYGAIKDPGLFDLMFDAGSLVGIKAKIEDIIYSCCGIKSALVQKDELDKGERQLLNFGHTIGHGIEKYYDFDKFTHGEAVAMGMLQITKLSEAKKLTEIGTYKRLAELLKLCRLYSELPSLDYDKLLDIISKDKKSSGDSINLILLRSIGNAYIHQIPKTQLKSFIINSGEQQ